MNIRFDVDNSKVKETLNKIAKSKRKYFIQEAIVYYLYALEYEPKVHSVFLEIEKAPGVMDKNGEYTF